jgi:hypothetical protein
MHFLCRDRPAFVNSFHGRTVGTMSLGNSKIVYKNQYGYGSSSPPSLCPQVIGLLIYWIFFYLLLYYILYLFCVIWMWVLTAT